MLVEPELKQLQHMNHTSIRLCIFSVVTALHTMLSWMILLLIHKSWPLQIKSKRTGFFLDAVWERFQKSGWSFASDLDDAYIYVPVLKIVILKNKWCKGFHSPPPMSRPMPSWSPNSIHLPKKPSLIFYCWMQCYTACNIPLVCWDQLSWLTPSKLLLTPRLLSEEQTGMKIKAWCCAITAQQQPKQWCVINTVSATNSKCSPIWAATMINSIPACMELCKLDQIHRSIHSILCASLKLSQKDLKSEVIWGTEDQCQPIKDPEQPCLEVQSPCAHSTHQWH